MGFPVVQVKAIHKITAEICKDKAEPPTDLELTEPDPLRRCARLLVILVIGALLVTAIVVLASRIPGTQSQRKTVNSKGDDTLAELLSTAVQNNETINCPCNSQVMSWCDVTTFHIFTQKKKNETTSSITYAKNYTKDEAGPQLENFICESPNSMAVIICLHILSPILVKEDSRTDLPTATAFTRRELLYTEIVTRIDTNAYEQSSSFTFLYGQNHTNMLLYNYSQTLVSLVRVMASQFNKTSSSSAEDFWKAAQDTYGTYNCSLGIAFGMDVDWDTYLEDCDARFCDIEYRVSDLNRVLRAVAQVGGITTIVCLMLQFLIWPGLRIALRFPTPKQTT